MHSVGNCFYLSFLFSLFETCIMETKDRSMLKKILKITKESKSKSYLQNKYITDCYKAFKKAVKGLKSVKPQNAEEHLINLLSDKEESNYIIMYARHLASNYIEANAS